MKYPIRNGLVVSPYELGYSIPTQEQLDKRKVTTNHHGWYERNRYPDRLHKVFRNLITNVFPMIADQHMDLHDIYTPPERPPIGLMIDVIEEQLAETGLIRCVYEQKTRMTHDISIEQWKHIRGGHVQEMVTV